MVTTTLLNWTVGLGLAIMTLLFIFRIVLTWYPQVELRRFPWLLIFWPTEPLLVPVRKWVPPIGGVDVAPVIWVGLITLLRELLVGQQGLLRMLG
ncbi:MAG: YggT family protein [Cyanobacteriota bacterium]|nr:YggT family protein [Cyanobacteriota bacterium]